MGKKTFVLIYRPLTAAREPIFKQSNNFEDYDYIFASYPLYECRGKPTQPMRIFYDKARRCGK